MFLDVKQASIIGDHKKNKERPKYRQGAGGTLIVVPCMALVHRARDPRIPTIPRLSTSGFHRPGRHRVHQALSAP